MKFVIRSLEVIAAALLAPLLSRTFYWSGWFSALVNSWFGDGLIWISRADAYENQVLVIDILALLIAFLAILAVILLLHWAISRTRTRRSVAVE